MFPVEGLEPAGILQYTQAAAELHGAACPISAHASFEAIGIEVKHPEVESRFVTDEDQAVGPNTEVPVTHARNQIRIACVKKLPAVINEDEVVSSAMVFRKRNLHQPVMSYVEMSLYDANFALSNRNQTHEQMLVKKN
jgi:hypothetical protein